MKFRYYFAVGLIILIAGVLSLVKANGILGSNEQQIENIVAFTKLSGYIRYFHPSDEAVNLDWDKFLVYGIKKVRGSKNTSQLKKNLEELFYPIAPTIQIYETGTQLTHTDLIINDDEHIRLVAWKHFGVKGSYGELYDSTIVESDNPKTIHIYGEELNYGDRFNKQINKRLSSDIPLVLAKDDSGTIGSNIELKEKYYELKRSLAEMPYKKMSHSNIDVRLANVTIIWNIIQHFYPYFDEVNVQWDEILEITLKEVIDPKAKDSYLEKLNKMLAYIDDGHAMVMANSLNTYTFPFQLDWIENEIVVTNTLPEAKVKSGDVIVSIDGIPAKDVLTHKEQYISGSNQLKRFKALKELSTSNKSNKIQLVVKREDNLIEIEHMSGALPSEFVKPGKIVEIEKNIYYVDLTTISLKDFEAEIDTLKDATGIIFDLRGYPNYKDLSGIFGYLIKQPIKTINFGIPQVIYPDHEFSGYFDNGDEFEAFWVQPSDPILTGKIVFLTYGGTASAPETLLGMVAGYDLGEIIGQATAGANGDKNIIALIGNERLVMFWTGLKVWNMDGTQFHLNGIQPTIPIERTIEAVREGRDEYIEKAIEVIKQ